MKSGIKKIMVAFAVVAVLTGCGNPATTPSASNPPVTPVAPSVNAIVPADLAVSVGVDSNVTATFDADMKPESINAATFFVKEGATLVDGTVTYSGGIATFDPAANFSRNKVYTATITTGAMSLAGTAMAHEKTWTFNAAAGPERVALGTAINFAILAKTGISNVPESVITGDIGVSPVAASGMTGFSLVTDVGGAFATSTQIVGKAYASNYASPTPTMMTSAIGDMEIAYADADGRLVPDYVNYNSGDLSGTTLTPGLYNWNSGVMATTDFTINGGANDTWIFQVSGLYYMAPGVKITLAGGAQAKNIVWKVNSVTLGSGASMDGIILSKTAVTAGSACVVTGRILAQTAVSLNSAIVTQPTP